MPKFQASLLKKGLWHRCFPINFAKFLQTPFLQNTFGRLILAIMLYHAGFQGYKMGSLARNGISNVRLCFRNFKGICLIARAQFQSVGFDDALLFVKLVRYIPRTKLKRDLMKKVSVLKRNDHLLTQFHFHTSF